MADANRYVVVHPKLNMTCGGKSQCVKVGTVLKGLTDSQVKRMGGKIKPLVAAEELSLKLDEEKKK